MDAPPKRVAVAGRAAAAAKAVGVAGATCGVAGRRAFDGLFSSLCVAIDKGDPSVRRAVADALQGGLGERLGERDAAIAPAVVPAC